MPTITTIGGIDINIYNGDHNPPHIHAVYNAQMRRIELWLEENREDALKIFQALNPNLRQ